MRVIILTRGQHTVVDDDVFEWASKFNWYAKKKRKSNTFYACRNTQRVDGTQTTVYLHREILNAPAAQVDHIDGDGLNNLRENLRRCTHGENQHNRHKQANNTSSFKGVGRHGGRWRARIQHLGAPVFLGHFDTALLAAQAYDRATWRYHGRFANFNFPRPWLRLRNENDVALSR